MKKRLLFATFLGAAVFFYILLGEDRLSFLGDISESGGREQSEVQKVVYIVDGDTFDITNGERVRLIGIDSPERGEAFYKEAKDHLSKMILGEEVVLKKDVSEVDRYGRLLRHVYIGDTWINKKMIEDGYARAVTFPPDVMHDEIFATLEKRSKEQGLGLWK